MDFIKGELMEKEMQVQEKLYIITHSGLPQQYQIPQAVHAAIQFANDYPYEQEKWFKASNTLIILAARDEQGLYKLIEKLDIHGLKYSKFFEPDIGNALTAIAIVPSPCAKRFCSNLPLAGKVKKDI